MTATDGTVADPVAALLDRARAALNDVVDPCSVAAGCPAGLVDMGLVSDVRVTPGDDGWQVSARLRLTEPGCMMGVSFLNAAQDRLRALPDVAAVHVSLDRGTEWTPAAQSEGYRRRLAEHRSRTLSILPR